MRTRLTGPHSPRRGVAAAIVLSAAIVLPATIVVGCAATPAASPLSGLPTSAVAPALATPSPTAASGSPTALPLSPEPSVASPSPSTIPAADLLARCPPDAASRKPTKIAERAEQGAFTVQVIHARSCTPIQISFTNMGALLRVFHNIAIPYGSEWLFRGPPARSTDPVTFTVPPLPAGAYRFLSQARPSMGGTFEISDQPPG